IDHDMTAHQAGKVDMQAVAVETEIGAVMDESLGMQPLGHLSAFHQFDGPLLQHAGPNATQYIVGAFPLENDVVDTVKIKQPSEHEPGRASADNGDFGAHRILPLPPPTVACSGLEENGRSTQSLALFEHEPHPDLCSLWRSAEQLSAGLAALGDHSGAQPVARLPHRTAPA